MTLVALTQRVIQDEPTEIREGLDIRWHAFLWACNITPVPGPNDQEIALELLDRVRPDGVVLTGGGDLHAYGGTAIERDLTEAALVHWARNHCVPIHGVCRGMQFLLHDSGTKLELVDGHVGTRHQLNGCGRIVNSYHRFGVRHVDDQWDVVARCGDVIEAVRHRSHRISATMWHPERETPPDPTDVEWFRMLFGSTR